MLKTDAGVATKHKTILSWSYIFYHLICDLCSTERNNKIKIHLYVSIRLLRVTLNSFIKLVWDVIYLRQRRIKYTLK